MHNFFNPPQAGLQMFLTPLTTPYRRIKNDQRLVRSWRPGFLGQLSFLYHLCFCIPTGIVPFFTCHNYRSIYLLCMHSTAQLLPLIKRSAKKSKVQKIKSVKLKVALVIVGTQTYGFNANKVVKTVGLINKWLVRWYYILDLNRQTGNRQKIKYSVFC